MVLNKSFLIVVFSLGLAACASNDPTKDPAYISPTQYQSYNCKQLNAEMKRVSIRREQIMVDGKDGEFFDTAVKVFAISQGYSVGETGRELETRRLRNQYDLLEQMLIEKECH